MNNHILDTYLYECYFQLSKNLHHIFLKNVGCFMKIDYIVDNFRREGLEFEINYKVNLNLFLNNNKIFVKIEIECVIPSKMFYNPPVKNFPFR